MFLYLFYNIFYIEFIYYFLLVALTKAGLNYFLYKSLSIFLNYPIFSRLRILKNQIIYICQVIPFVLLTQV